MKRISKYAGIIFVSLIIVSCQSVYYAAWEKMGKEKRHLLRDQVENIRSDQQEASEQFNSVLEKIQALYGFEGGELEEFYENLLSEYEDCKDQAETVSDRIKEVEEIAEDLFEEWENEINEIDNPKFKSDSRQSLELTRKKYSRLHLSMLNAEKSMNPVLNSLNDYVLYMKHNLNAQAIGALKREAGEIETDVKTLINEMNKSIKEADDFLKSI